MSADPGSCFSGVIIPRALVLCSRTSFCAACHAYARPTGIVHRCYRCGLKFRYTIILSGGSLTLDEGAVASGQLIPTIPFLGSGQKQSIDARRVYCLDESWIGPGR